MSKRSKINHMEPNSPSLLSLPLDCLLCVLSHCEAAALVQLEAAAKPFAARLPGSRLGMCEFAAKRALQASGDPLQHGEMLRVASWKERLHLERDCGCGFDRAVSEGGGFAFAFSADGARLRAVHLAGMGPKLLLSDLSTADKPRLRWRLRVRGNTAVEFGVVPADLVPSPTALHKCCAVPSHPEARAMGFCSQITAGSLLPLKAPVMRGTILDITAQRGRIEVVCSYPKDAKEISWLDGQPVQRPYRGPSTLRFEQEFSPDHHVRLAITSWARAHFEVLHSGFAVDAAWAAESLEAERRAAAAGAGAAASAATPPHQPAQGAPHPAAVGTGAEPMAEELGPLPAQPQAAPHLPELAAPASPAALAAAPHLLAPIALAEAAGPGPPPGSAQPLPECADMPPRHKTCPSLAGGSAMRQFAPGPSAGASSPAAAARPPARAFGAAFRAPQQRQQQAAGASVGLRRVGSEGSLLSGDSADLTLDGKQPSVGPPPPPAPHLAWGPGR